MKSRRQKAVSLVSRRTGAFGRTITALGAVALSCIGLAVSIQRGDASPTPDFALTDTKLAPIPSVGLGGALNGARPRTGVSAHLLRYYDYLNTQSGTTSEYWTAHQNAIALRKSDLSLAKAAGMEFVRTDYNWDYSEKPDAKGTYTFDQRDQLASWDATVRDISEQGMQTQLVMGYNNDAYTDPNTGKASNEGSLKGIAKGEAGTNDRNGFANWAAATAAHFQGKNVIYEIWNEPNYSFFWQKPDGVAYAQLVDKTIRSMRAVDANAEITTGGVWTSNPSWIRDAVGAGALALRPGFGLHPYRAIPEGLLGTAAESDPSDINMAALRAIIGKDVAVYNTEDGYSSYGQQFYHDTWRGLWDGYDGATNGHSDKGRQEQAVLGMRKYLVNWAVGAKTFTWYDLRDDSTNATDLESNFGMLDTAGQPKPVYVGLKNVMKFTNALLLTGAFHDSTTGYNLLRFGETKYIAWIESLNRTRTYQIPSGSTAQLLLNNRILKTEPCGDQVCVTLHGFDGPISIDTSAADTDDATKTTKTIPSTTAPITTTTRTVTATTATTATTAIAKSTATAASTTNTPPINPPNPPNPPKTETAPPPITAPPKTPTTKASPASTEPPATQSTTPVTTTPVNTTRATTAPPTATSATATSPTTTSPPATRTTSTAPTQAGRSGRNCTTNNEQLYCQEGDGPRWLETENVTSYSLSAHRLCVVAKDRVASCKEGALDSGWVFQEFEAVQIKASDNRVCVRTTKQLQCKEGKLDAEWVVVGDGTVTDFDVSPHRVCMNVQGGWLSCKEGDLSAKWVFERADVTQLGVTDNRICMVTTDTNLSCKEGGLSTDWSVLGSNVTAFVVKPNRICSLIDTGVYCRDGAMNGEPVVQLYGTRALAASDDQVCTLQAAVAQCKRGSLNAEWYPVSSSADSVSVA